MHVDRVWSLTGSYSKLCNGWIDILHVFYHAMPRTNLNVWLVCDTYRTSTKMVYMLPTCERLIIKVEKDIFGKAIFWRKLRWELCQFDACTSGQLLKTYFSHIIQLLLSFCLCEKDQKHAACERQTDRHVAAICLLLVLAWHKETWFYGQECTRNKREFVL